MEACKIGTKPTLVVNKVDPSFDPALFAHKPIKVLTDIFSLESEAVLLGRPF